MRPCRCILCLGLAAGVALSHDPPHSLEPTPGQQTVAFGKNAIERSSTSSGPRHYRLVAEPGAYTITGSPVHFSYVTSG